MNLTNESSSGIDTTIKEPIQSQPYKKWFFVVIGILYMLVSSYFLISFTKTYLHGNMDYLVLYIGFLSCTWIPLYTGYLYIKQENLGQKILRCLYPLIISILLLIIFTLIIVISEGRIQKYLANYSTYSIFVLVIYTILLLIMFFQSIKKNPNFYETDEKHKIWVGKFLSFFSPGFGRIILGKYVSGYIVNTLYTIMQIILAYATYTSYDPDTGIEIEFNGTLGTFPPKLFLWLIFWIIDSSYIVKFQNALENKISESDAITETPPIIDINQDLQGES